MTLGPSIGSKSETQVSQIASAGRRGFRLPLASLRARLPRWVVAALLLGSSISAQSPGVPQVSAAEGGQTGSRFPQQQPSSPLPPSMDQKRISVLNRMRQKAIIDDATRLLILAQELNTESAAMPSAERIHKAAEIEKLAKSVKEKMSYAVGDNPAAPGFMSVLPQVREF